MRTIAVLFDSSEFAQRARQELAAERRLMLANVTVSQDSAILQRLRTDDRTLLPEGLALGGLWAGVLGGVVGVVLATLTLVPIATAVPLGIAVGIAYGMLIGAALGRAHLRPPFAMLRAMLYRGRALLLARTTDEGEFSVERFLMRRRGAVCTVPAISEGLDECFALR